VGRRSAYSSFAFLLQNTRQQQQDDDDDDGGGGGRGCRQYGLVDETVTSAAAAAGRRRTVICGDHRRDKLVVRSKSNVVHVVLNRPLTNATDRNFLLRFYGELCCPL